MSFDSSAFGIRPRVPLCVAARAALAGLCLAAASVLAYPGLDGGGAEGSLSREQAFALALEANTLQDRPAALHWLRQAAADGLQPAQELLGAMLLQGEALGAVDGAADACEARHWFHQAAQQGSAIGRMHRDFINRSPAGRRCR